MKYYHSKIVESNFEEAIQNTTEALKSEGFGVLTDIDIQATLKQKLQVDFRRYRILGACNPQYAYEALQTEDKVGAMLPCNVIVQELQNGEIEIAAINPQASMMAIDNPTLAGFALEVNDRLKRVIDGLK